MPRSFTYDGEDMLVQNWAGFDSTYLNGPGIDNKLSAKLAGGTSSIYYHLDHLGTPTGNSNAAGSLTAYATPDSYGNGSFEFTGREYDDFTTLYYYRARMYDPKLGRFISEDPIGFAGGDINIYAYVWNSPQRFTDPFGLNPDYPIDLGSKWRGRVDTTNNAGEGFEIHVVDPSGRERGIVNGRNGWIGKHGRPPFPPDDMPRTSLNRLNGLNLDELRARGLVPPKGFSNVNPYKGGGYLFPGRTLYGVAGTALPILGLASGLIADFETYRNSIECNRTFDEQLRRQHSESPILITPFGIIENPYYAPIS